MPRPAGPPRPLKQRPCTNCGTTITEVRGRNLRKTCSPECYKASRPTHFVNDKANDKAQRERREYLRRNYEPSVYDIQQV